MSKGAVISLHSFCKLIICTLILLGGCNQKKDTSSNKISIIWKDGKATGISIPGRIVNRVPKDSLHSQVEVRLAKHGQQPVIAGAFIIGEDELIFEPLLPFTRGLLYEVYVQHGLVGGVEIAKATSTPELLAIYPSKDSLPENLLKIYLAFSKPMVEGHSLQYVRLTDQKGDSLPGIFLNLPQELWNTEGTILTLWLDPGRIKRHLQPNESLGPPLIKGQRYKLMISPEWPDIEGTSLGKSYTKNFVATLRDTISPSPASWKLVVPETGTKQPLALNLPEPLDYSLLQEAISVIDSSGNIVTGSVQIDSAEMKYHFTPVKPWARGLYKLQIEGRLEDLAGNNLNRLFDVDLKAAGSSQPAKKVFEREWRTR